MGVRNALFMTMRKPLIIYFLIVLLLVLFGDTTPQQKNPNRLVGRECRLPQQKVGRGSVLPTDTVGHRKSGRQRPLPTDYRLPTDGPTPRDELSRPTIPLPTDHSFPTDICLPTDRRTAIVFPTDFLLAPAVGCCTLQLFRYLNAQNQYIFIFHSIIMHIRKQ